jgi:hypothetical protein
MVAAANHSPVATNPYATQVPFYLAGMPPPAKRVAASKKKAPAKHTKTAPKDPLQLVEKTTVDSNGKPSGRTCREREAGRVYKKGHHPILCTAPRGSIYNKGKSVAETLESKSKLSHRNPVQEPLFSGRNNTSLGFASWKKMWSTTHQRTVVAVAQEPPNASSSSAVLCLSGVMPAMPVTTTGADDDYWGGPNDEDYLGVADTEMLPSTPPLIANSVLFRLEEMECIWDADSESKT